MRLAADNVALACAGGQPNPHPLGPGAEERDRDRSCTRQGHSPEGVYVYVNVTLVNMVGRTTAVAIRSSTRIVRWLVFQSSAFMPISAVISPRR